MPCPSQSSWFDHPNDIWWGIQSIKFLVVESTLPCYLVPLAYIFSSAPCSLKLIPCMSCFEIGRTVGWRKLHVWEVLLRPNIATNAHVHLDVLSYFRGHGKSRKGKVKSSSQRAMPCRGKKKVPNYTTDVQQVRFPRSKKEIKREVIMTSNTALLFHSSIIIFNTSLDFCPNFARV
jgi:hypothetical protein